MIAAPHRALETSGYFDAEQHLARLQEIVELGHGVDFMGEAEIGGVLHRFQDRAAEVVLLLQQHGGRQIVRRGVDGEAEQHQLHYRQHHDHRERDAVTAQLDEFLHQHRIAAPPEAEPRLRGIAILVCIDRTHWKLSFERFIRSMNTSSSDGAPCCQCHPLPSRWGAMAASSAAASRPETCRLLPNGATMSTPGLPNSSAASPLRSSPVTV